MSERESSGMAEEVAGHLLELPSTYGAKLIETCQSTLKVVEYRLCEGCPNKSVTCSDGNAWTHTTE